MVDNIKSNEIRLCIRYEYQRDPNLPSFEGYKHFCRALGDDVMSFRDFDIWWYRFANGHMDLDYDGSVDQSAFELMDMPLDVMENIIENLNLKEKFIFRKVSDTCRTVIDSMPIKLEEIKISGSELGIEVTIDNKFKPTVADFCHILNNPKTRIEKFKMWMTKEPVTTTLRNFLSGRQIHVKSFQLELEFWAHTFTTDDIQYQAMAALPYFKPGVLESIELNSEILCPRYTIMVLPGMRIDELVKLEQWKRATTFRCYIPVEELLDSFAHFHEIYSVLGTIEPTDVIRLRDMFMKSPDFISCELYCWPANKEILDELGAVDQQTSVTYGTMRIEVQNRSIYFERMSQS